MSSGLIITIGPFAQSPKHPVWITLTFSIFFSSNIFLKFSIDATRCIGACGLAPVFTVNEEVYGKATPQKVDEVIKEYQNRG